MEKTEVLLWLRKVESDMNHAYLSMESSSYDWSTLAAQQASEKALKAVNIFKGNYLIKIHDLTILARKVNAPKEVLLSCGLLNPFYTSSRYPDDKVEINEKAAADAINAAKEIITWCKEQIKISN